MVLSLFEDGDGCASQICTAQKGTRFFKNRFEQRQAARKEQLLAEDVLLIIRPRKLDATYAYVYGTRTT